MTLPTVEPIERDKPNGPRSRKGAATRARLLDAAKAVFEEDGFLEARISDIAEKAGLSHGSFYHYFDSKEQIFREVAMALSDFLNTPLDTVIFEPGSSLTPRERIRASNWEYLDNYRKEARIIGVIEQVSRYDAELNSARFEHQRRDTDRVVVSIRQLQRRGFVDEAVNPVLAAFALGAMVARFAEMWLVQQHVDFDFDEGVDQITALFVNALQLRDEPVRPAGH
ncbi:TetR/AcrR family transcriptional regulator [Frankia sp. AgKG'84/4]|uniref:TetR/AcrR family transcriptional regulator n=1 Tax=Frankia sp. AgKG'84/4 TaxID=573490 RepID=UPI00200D92BC|nr:TetR/AcrR family transcriptional regulator [Frankia sp. AgKG'84/4]MCL9793502.1 TetR/AcrR family transcriptional regulator [Frankia sp. AgKG'84/4]